MPYDFKILYCKGQVGRKKEGDNFETESMAEKFIQSKQKGKLNHN
jgi:hypothetical protein